MKTPSQEHDPGPTTARPLVELSPPVVRERIAAVPPPAGADLTVPVVALHAADDPGLPNGKLARLDAVIGEVEPLTRVTFDGVGIKTNGRSWWIPVRDLWQTTPIVDRMLRASR